MNNSNSKYYFYHGYNGLSANLGQNQLGQEKVENELDKFGFPNSQFKKEDNVISFMGIKLSYAKAFGVVFLIIFLLLFFPGIGVSSSAVKDKPKVEDAEQDNCMGETKIR